MPSKLSFDTLPHGSLGYAIGMAAANGISKHSGVTTTAVPTGGSSVIPPQVN